MIRVGVQPASMGSSWIHQGPDPEHIQLVPLLNEFQLIQMRLKFEVWTERQRRNLRSNYT